MQDAIATMLMFHLFHLPVDFHLWNDIDCRREWPWWKSDNALLCDLMYENNWINRGGVLPVCLIRCFCLSERNAPLLLVLNDHSDTHAENDQ